MGDNREDSRDELTRHGQTLVQLGEAMPGTGLAVLGEQMRVEGHWPEDLRYTPVIIDTDIGGDADDALAVATAARCVSQLALVITADETGGTCGYGQRARFARWLLDAIDRPDVAVAAGASLGDTRYYVVGDLIPDDVPAQSDDVITAVQQVCEATEGPVRWVGMGPLSNLARVIDQAPELAARLRVTQMGGALRYRDPEAAEHNIRLDVPAARTVLEAVANGRLAQPEFIASEVTFTPRMEVTTASPLYAKFHAADAPEWARMLAVHLDRWFERFYPGTMQHDALTLSAALELPFVDSDRLPIVMDAIGRTTSPDDGIGVTVRWSISAEYEAFMRWLTEKLDPAVPADGPILTGEG